MKRFKNMARAYWKLRSKYLSKKYFEKFGVPIAQGIEGFGRCVFITEELVEK